MASVELAIFFCACGTPALPEHLFLCVRGSPHLLTIFFCACRDARTSWPYFLCVQRRPHLLLHLALPVLEEEGPGGCLAVEREGRREHREVATSVHK